MRALFQNPLLLSSAVFLVVGLGPSPARAVTTCTHRGVERVIEVLPAPDRAGVPCEVHYEKQKQNAVLWSSQNSRAFCEERAAALVGALDGAGWHCAETPPPSAPLPSLSAPPPRASTPSRVVATIEAPPAAIQDEGADAPPSAVREPVPTRSEIARDPRLRFYRRSVGLAALEETLEIVRVDLNRDGREELFLRVGDTEACAGSCPWDLFQVGANGRLESLGIHGFRAWRILERVVDGYPGLVVQGDEGVGVFQSYRYALGLYRLDREDDEAARLWGAARTLETGVHAQRVDTVEP